MEQNPTTDAAILNVQDHTNLPQQHASHQPQKKIKKKRSAMNMIRVAIFMMRRRSSKSKRLAVHGGKTRSIWDKLLGSMRPLHLESNQSPPASLIQSDDNKDAPQLLALPSPDHGGEEALFTAIQSPAVMASSLEGCSKYSSAIVLSELDSDGDEMIDTKAEEFIAQFYAEMKQQDHMERLRQKGMGH